MVSVNVSLQTFLSLNRRARKACQRKAINQWKQRSAISETPINVHPTETRDEILERARDMVDNLRSQRQRIGFGRIRQSKRDIRATHNTTVNILETVARLRRTAILRDRLDTNGRAFYVSIRNGSQYGLLYGPLPSQAAALRAKPYVRQIANDVNAGDSAFAAFGTCSINVAEAKPGILNAYIPDDVTAYLARAGYTLLSKEAA